MSNSDKRPTTPAEERAKLLDDFIKKGGKVEKIPYGVTSQDMGSSNQNAGYFPILFNNQKERDSVYEALLQKNIQSRAYFSPSLNSLKHLIDDENFDCPVSEIMVDRVLCLLLR